MFFHPIVRKVDQSSSKRGSSTVGIPGDTAVYHLQNENVAHNGSLSVSRCRVVNQTFISFTRDCLYVDES